MTMTTTTETARAAALNAAFALLPPIFRRCVEPEPGYRFDLTAPVVQAGHVYATDGRIAVRVAATPELVPVVEAAKPAGKFPVVHTMPQWDASAYEPDATPLPDLSGLPKCPE